MEDHEKLKKLSEFRKLKEDRALNFHKQMQQELQTYEKKLSEKKQEVDQFLQKRGVQLQALQNKIRTEAVSGQIIEQYLFLQEDTRVKTDELYQELEEMSQGYYPLLDKVNKSYQEWDGVHQSRTKLEELTDKKKEEFEEERAQEEDRKMYLDFFGKRTSADEG